MTAACALLKANGLQKSLFRVSFESMRGVLPAHEEAASGRWYQAPPKPLLRPGVFSIPTNGWPSKFDRRQSHASHA